jgi:hypothetical protein
MKREILVVSFGTTSEESRRLNIGAVEQFLPRLGLLDETFGFLAVVGVGFLDGGIGARQQKGFHLFLVGWNRDIFQDKFPAGFRMPDGVAGDAVVRGETFADLHCVQQRGNFA